MSTLSSASSLADVEAAYDDNASYEEDQSTSKALAFRTACRILFRMLPKRAVKGERGEEEIELDLGLIAKELERVESWLAANPVTSAASRTKYVDFSGFRN